VGRNLCIHGVNELDPSALRAFSVLATTSTRRELLEALGALPIDTLVIDLDSSESVDLVVAVRELRPSVGIVGVTGRNDLTAAIAAQRAGCNQFVTRPIDVPDLLDAMHRVHAARNGTARGSTIALIGATGGCGVTTLACHLAAELAAVSRTRTAIMDLDLEFGGVARAFDLTPVHTLADLARAGAIDADLLSRAAAGTACGIDVFARPATLQETLELDESGIERALHVASASYSYLVLDLPRRLTALTGFAIECCTKLLLVMQLTVPSVDNARRLIQAIGQSGVSPDQVEIVVNRYRRSMHQCTIELLEQQLSRKVFGIVPNDYQAVREAIDTGRPLSQRNPVRAAIHELAQRLVSAENAPARPGWMSFLPFKATSSK
jgi:pilus assembly protein CpaE